MLYYIRAGLLLGGADQRCAAPGNVYAIRRWRLGQLSSQVFRHPKVRLRFLSWRHGATGCISPARIAHPDDTGLLLRKLYFGDPRTPRRVYEPPYALHRDATSPAARLVYVANLGRDRRRGGLN